MKVVKFLLGALAVATGLIIILDRLVEWAANSEYATMCYPEASAVHPYTEDDETVTAPDKVEVDDDE